jgi:hypothetical protein
LGVNAVPVGAPFDAQLTLLVDHPRASGTVEGRGSWGIAIDPRRNLGEGGCLEVSQNFQSMLPGPATACRPNGAANLMLRSGKPAANHLKDTGENDLQVPASDQ